MPLIILIALLWTCSNSTILFSNGMTSSVHSILEVGGYHQFRSWHYSILYIILHPIPYASYHLVCSSTAAAHWVEVPIELSSVMPWSLSWVDQFVQNSARFMNLSGLNFSLQCILLGIDQHWISSAVVLSIHLAWLSAEVSLSSLGLTNLNDSVPSEKVASSLIILSTSFPDHE